MFPTEAISVTLAMVSLSESTDSHNEVDQESNEIFAEDNAKLWIAIIIAVLIAFFCILEATSIYASQKRKAQEIEGQTANVVTGTTKTTNTKHLPENSSKKWYE